MEVDVLISEDEGIQIYFVFRRGAGQIKIAELMAIGERYKLRDV